MLRVHFPDWRIKTTVSLQDELPSNTFKFHSVITNLSKVSNIVHKPHPFIFKSLISFQFLLIA